MSVQGGFASVGWARRDKKTLPDRQAGLTCAQSAVLAETIQLSTMLREVAKQVARREFSAAAHLLESVLERVRSFQVAEDPKDLVDSTSLVCRHLYDHGRSGDAVALVREVHALCGRSGERTQLRRASFLLAMMLADTADLVGAIERYLEALRIAAADEDRLEMARVWGNLGAAFVYAGRHELSERCSQRCLDLLEPLLQPSPVRRAALSNLAQCCYHLGKTNEGIYYGEWALVEMEALREDATYSEILLHRNMARLLLDAERVDEAEEHVVRATVLADKTEAPRAFIAAEMTRAAHDLATGSADRALTRIDRTLEKARTVPSTLLDALACAVRAEDAAGFPARALERLREFSDHLFSHAVQSTRRAIELAGIDPSEPLAEKHREGAGQYLANRLEPPAPPASWGALRRLGASAVLRMDVTGWHGVRVGTLVRALARAHGMGAIRALEMGLASELHDIGMSSVPAAVLNNLGALNAGERSIVSRHTEAGGEMLIGEPHVRMLLARDIARYHHARWDGRGYPEGVGAEAIPLGARMCSVADAYDAMVAGIGRCPISMGEALEELHREAGTQFDPELVSCFDAVVNGCLEDLGLGPASVQGMEAFQELVTSLREDRGYV
jgi:putative two-component system response regulator